MKLEKRNDVRRLGARADIRPNTDAIRTALAFLVGELREVGRDDAADRLEDVVDMLRGKVN